MAGEAHAGLEVRAQQHQSEGSTLTKLWNEADVLLGGTARGFAAAADSALRNWKHTLPEFALSAVTGAGLALAQRSTGPLGLGAEILGLSFTAAFLKNALDGNRWHMVGQALSQTYRSGANLERSKNQVAAALGPLTFDTALMWSGGALGAGISRGFKPRLPELSAPVLEKPAGLVPAAVEAVPPLTRAVAAEVAGVVRPVVRWPGEAPKPEQLDSRYLAGMVIENLDPVSAGHSLRVSLYGNLLAEKVGLPASQLEVVRLAGIGHDLGKSVVPLDILNKPGKLTAEERSLMNRHAQWTEDILAQLPFAGRLNRVPFVAGSHHELYSGSGYLRGLQGEQIPLETRIITVADIFDALTASRPYKDGMSVEEALALMKRLHMNKPAPDLDPHIFRVFESIPSGQLNEIRSYASASDIPAQRLHRELPASPGHAGH